MITWTFRKTTAVLGLAALAACTEIAAPDGSAEDGLAPAMTSVQMLRGVAANAPEGYCFDGASLTQQFALLARCDTLGMQGAGPDTPLAVITMTLAEFAEDALPQPEALVSADETLLQSESRARLQLAKIDGKPPLEGLSGQYWRGAGPVGADLLMGLALYQSDLDDDMGVTAPELLEQAFTRTADGLDGSATAAQPNKKDPANWVAGLFSGNNSSK